MRWKKAARRLALGQGIFYLVTGIWPLVSIGTFQKVTGPKADLWLVKTVGALISVIGAVLVAAGLRRRLTPEAGMLAAGSAAVLATIDTVYVAKRRIAPVYLLDAAMEAALVAGWAAVGARRRKR